MKTKYICLNCGHMFDAIKKSSNPYKFGECPECESDEYLEDDTDVADALRSWLDPWHPATEPPEDGTYIVFGLGKIAMDVWHDGGWHYSSFQAVTHWRDLPPMPEVNS
jgi:hypothetical protein